MQLQMSCSFISSIYFLSGKVGYGTTSEALAYKVPLVFVRRDYFNEEPFLRNMIEVHALAIVLLFTYTLVLLGIQL